MPEANNHFNAEGDRDYYLDLHVLQRDIDNLHYWKIVRIFLCPRGHELVFCHFYMHFSYLFSVKYIVFLYVLVQVHYHKYK